MRYDYNQQPPAGICLIPICPVASKTLTTHRLLDGLPPALKTANNLALLRAYLSIPQPNIRRFVLSLLTRLAGQDDAAYPFGDISEAEYLLMQYARLPVGGGGDMRGKVIALVRDICAANRGGAYEA